MERLLSRIYVENTILLYSQAFLLSQAVLAIGESIVWCIFSYSLLWYDFKSNQHFIISLALIFCIRGGNCKGAGGRRALLLICRQKHNLSVFV